MPPLALFCLGVFLGALVLLLIASYGALALWALGFLDLGIRFKPKKTKPRL